MSGLRIEKTHNEKLRNLYFPPDIVRMVKLRIRLTGHVACMGEMPKAYQIFVGKSEGMRPLGSYRFG
jgi:hypothetical protein